MEGLSLFNSPNNYISDINANQSGFGGIYFYNSSRNQLTSITSYSSPYYAISLSTSSNNTFINSNIGNCSNPFNACVTLESSSKYNIFSGGMINKSSKNLIYFASSSDNNILQDMILTGSSLNDTYLYGSAMNNSFINVSYNISKENVDNFCQLYRKWHYVAYVNDSLGNPVFNATISAYNITKFNVFNMSTNSSGYTNDGSIIQYANYGGTRTYYSNYTINVTKAGFTTSKRKHDVSKELNILNDTYNITDISPPNVTNIKVINESKIIGGKVHRGENITFNLTVTDNTNVTVVWMNIWKGVSGISEVLWTGLLNFISGNLWSITIGTDYLSWPLGNINYTIYSNDTLNNTLQLNSSFILYQGINITNCSLIDEPGYYILMNDIIPSGIPNNGTCINITTSNITFDCDYKWISNRSFQISGIYAGKNIVNVTIKNCNVSLNGDGIYFNNVNNSIINNVTISSNNNGIILISSNSNNLQNITANSNNNGIILNSSNSNNLQNINLDLEKWGVISIENSYGNILSNIYTSNSLNDGGLSLSNSSNNNLINITSNSDYSGVISLDNSHDNNITNISSSETINGPSISLTNSYNNYFNQMDLESSFSYGVQLDYSYSNIFENGFINKSGISGIYFNSDSSESSNSVQNNIFRNFNISQSVSTDIYYSNQLNTGVYMINNTFINVSYNTEDLSQGNCGYQGNICELIRKWYYQAYVNDTIGNDVNNAIVSAFNVTGSNEFSILTNSSGWTNTSTITEYKNNNGIRSYYSNYTIDVSKEGFSTFTKSHNITIELNIFNDKFNISDYTPPTLTIEPINNYKTNIINPEFNVYAYENLSYCIISFDNFSTNYSMNKISDYHYQYSHNFVNEGNYYVEYYCSDIYGNINSSVSNRIDIDITTPKIIVNSPLSQEYNINNILFDVSSNENLSNCSISLDNRNSYYLLNKYNDTHFNGTLSVPNGNFLTLFFCYDLFSNLNNSETLQFNVSLPTNNINSVNSGSGGSGTLIRRNNSNNNSNNNLTNMNSLNDNKKNSNNKNNLEIENPKTQDLLSNSLTSCTEWSNCNLQYGLKDIISKETFLQSFEERECTIRNSSEKDRIGAVIIQKRECNVSYTIKPKKAKVCYGEYLEVYSGNSLVSRIDTLDKKNLDIYFNIGTNYCPYCYDGIKDHDETQIDCGGNCPKCETNVSKSNLLTVFLIILFTGLFLSISFLLWGYINKVKIYNKNLNKLKKLEK